MKEYIKLLDLPEEFDLADLKKAYRKKVLQYHPDKASNEAERIGYEATMKKLNEANAYLKEYLENHGGKYSKDTETYNYSDDSSTQETTDEFDYEENNEEEYSEYEDEYNEYDEDDEYKEVEEDYTNTLHSLLYQSFAKYFKIYKGITTGTLYLYSNALHFESAGFEEKQISKTIYFDNIADIEKEGFSSTLKIIYNDNTSEKFTVYQCNAWIRVLYIALMKGNYQIARTSSAFDNMNRQYDNSDDPETEIEYFLDIPKWLDDWGWIKIFARWCIELNKQNFNVILDIIKGIFKLILRIILIPILISNCIEAIVSIFYNLMWNYNLAIFLTAMSFSLLPNKLLFKKKILLVFLGFVVFFTYIYSGDFKFEIPINSNLSQQTIQNEENKTTNNDVTLNNSRELGQYMQDVQSSIKRNWVIPSEVSASGINHIKITVAFTVFKDGRLIGEPKIKLSSGVERADELCIEAVKLTAPFKPLSPEINKDYIDMEFTFEATRN